MVSEKVTVYIKDQSGERTGFLVRSEAPFEKIAKEYCKRKNALENTYSFIIDGQRIGNQLKTIAELGLNSADGEENVVESVLHVVGGAVDDDEGAEEKTITLKVESNGEEISFKLKKTTKLSKIFKAYAERKGVAIDSLSFIFDGRRLNPDHSPKQCEMEDDDVINAMVQQQGGYFMR